MPIETINSRTRRIRASILLQLSFVYLLILLGIAPSLADVDCSISGDDAYRSARLAGFSFTVKKTSGSGSCESGENDPWFIASASSDGPVECDVEIFGGRLLGGGWKIHKITLSGAATFNRRDPTIGSRRVSARFGLRAETLQDRKIFLREIVLTGPNCEVWQDAFESSVSTP